MKTWFFFTIFSDLSLDAALEEGDHLNELSLRPEHDRTFSVMSRKPLYAPMMETIKPYRDKLIQAKRQLDGAWKGEATSQPVVISSQPDDVHELRENLSRVSIHCLVPSLLSANFAIISTSLNKFSQHLKILSTVFSVWRFSIF